MRRSAWIFLAAILLPSLALAWMAVRSARDQQVILEHQQAIICQDITDVLAKHVQEQMDNSRSAFVQVTDQLLQTSRSPQALAANFNRILPAAWNLAEVGFAVDVKGIIYAPRPQESLEARTFRTENDRFLSNRENVEVFAQAPQKSPPKILVMNEKGQATVPPSQAESQQSALPDNQVENSQAARQKSKASKQNLSNTLKQGQASNRVILPSQQQQDTAQPEVHSPDWTTNDLGRLQSQNATAQNSSRNAAQSNQTGLPNNPSPFQSAQAQQQAAVQNDSQLDQAKNPNARPKQAKQKPPPQRVVEPQSNLGQGGFSNTLPEESDFRRVMGSASSGSLARFLEDRLRLMVWYRPKNGNLVFGAQIMELALIETLKPLLPAIEVQKGNVSGISFDAYILAILDDRGKPVALSRSGIRLDYKHPFAATEIGEALPHWEAALYLADPRQINRSASTLRLTLGLVVAVLIAAILLGGWLMATDVRRQMRLAQQKTDFVSNVSHELKTPLTSIRMFADMLAEGRVEERDRQNNYLRIISAESARLTRLINNVLDFARMERGAPAKEGRPCDLVEVVKEVVDTCRLHLENVGVALTVEMGADELPVIADRDALAQIVLNLLSNAEKYGGHQALIRVRREETAGGPAGCVDVLDRGPGIPAKKREAIFEPFRRLDESQASEASGSGLGLTLARRMARAHGGDVTYSPREGGGSCFTLCLPLSATDAKITIAQKPGNQVT